MPMLAAPALRTIEQALDGTPTALVIPEGISVAELRCIGTEAWAYQTDANDESYPVLADTQEIIPFTANNTGCPFLVSGSGTLSIALYGDFYTDPALAVRVGPAPAASVVPAVTGTLSIGSTLTCSTGTWKGDPDFTYQWQRQGVDIEGATASTHVLVAADAGVPVRCQVTGTNDIAATTVASNSVTAGFTAPANTVAPAVTGLTPVGSLLTTTDGTWTGSPTIAYTYQWQADGADIVGATANTYTTLIGDLGKAIRCVVTATNTVSAVAANSNAVTVTA